MKSFAVLFLLLTGVLRAAPLALVPLPQLVQTNFGSFTLCPTQAVPGSPAVAATKILAANAAQTAGEYLALTLLKSTGFRFEVSTNTSPTAAASSILLTTNGALSGLGAEGYELTVTPTNVLIRAPKAAGLFYGVQTFLQMLPPEVYSPLPASPPAWTAPCAYIQDAPRFSWRGWMLDSVRHFFTKDEVKAMIDTMAVNKLNVLHWHLDDDSGWRLEIKKWPLLTQVGAWRMNIMFGLNPRSSTAWNDNGLYGGFYTQDEVREIVAYAAQRFVTIVPEIEMPGHSTAALTAYPQFSCGCPTCFNVPFSLSVTSYIGGVFCIARPETTNFLQDVLTEVMDLFPSQYIHIGGDEVRFNNWTNHILDQQMTNVVGTTSLRVYQGWFAQQVANWIKGKGRTMMGWSEIMNGATVTNTALMDWLNTRAVQAATNSLYVVMAPSTTLYINMWETANNTSGSGVIFSNEPPGQSGLCTLTNVYAYEPIPTNLPPAYTNFILGAEGPAWSEFIPSLQNLQFRVFPRLCAIAEVDWTPAAQKNWGDFTNRLETQKKRLTMMGVNFNPAKTPPVLGTWTAPVSTNYTTLSWNITANVTAPGDFTASFCWKTGANGLDIAWAALLENGVEIDRDTHAGFSGASPTYPVYVFRLPALRPGAVYTLQASVAGRGGTASSGTIYRPNWN